MPMHMFENLLDISKSAELPFFKSRMLSRLKILMPGVTTLTTPATMLPNVAAPEP